MKNKELQNLITNLYTNEREFTLHKANKYTKVINLKLQEQKIDYALAFSLVLKIFELIEPLESKDVK